MSLTTAERDRVAGTLLATAAGDALGAPYEFGPPLPEDTVVAMTGGGSFGWSRGEWTDDTVHGRRDRRAHRRGSRTCATRRRRTPWWPAGRSGRRRRRTSASRPARCSPCRRPPRRRSPRPRPSLHARTGRTGGNGSLMRTAPVALAYLDDDTALAEVAATISALTHHDPEAGEACVLWCLAIAHAVRTGELDVRVGLAALAPGRADVWSDRIAVAERSTPADFAHNGWVVEAFQAAWCAIATTRGDDRPGPPPAGSRGRRPRRARHRHRRGHRRRAAGRGPRRVGRARGVAAGPARLARPAVPRPGPARAALGGRGMAPSRLLRVRRPHVRPAPVRRRRLARRRGRAAPTRPPGSMPWCPCVASTRPRSRPAWPRTTVSRSGWSTRPRTRRTGSWPSSWPTPSRPSAPCGPRGARSCCTASRRATRTPLVGAAYGAVVRGVPVDTALDDVAAVLPRASVERARILLHRATTGRGRAGQAAGSSGGSE